MLSVIQTQPNKYHICHGNDSCGVIIFFHRGADINWEGPDDKSPLHVAASAGNRAVTQLLLGFGADIRAKDNN